MATVRVNGVNLYYGDSGSGEPVLMILGASSQVADVPYLVESYSRNLRFIAYDRRGCGRSDDTDSAYGIADLADEAAGLLDKLRLKSAVVYGISLGGMLAQELALRHPAKVRALILGCTTAGIVRGVRPSAETLAAMTRNRSLSGDDAIEAGWPLGYSAAWIAANRESMLARERATARLYPISPASAMRQVIAATKHDTYDRLDQIACPVMLIHGAEDVSIPPGNSGMLAELIPHAELHMLDGLGHGYFLEGQAIADALILDFVERVVAGEATTKTEGAAHATR